MVRTYQRKTLKGADGERYTRSNLEKAVQEVKDGKKTIRGASKAYDIPRTTLKHYLRGTRGMGNIAKSGKGGGGKMALSYEAEMSLATCIKTMEKWGFGLSRQEVLDVVQMFVKSNDIKTPFKEGRPGEDWFLSFSNRHNFSIKKPQGVEYVRMSQVNPFVVHDFFDLVSSKMNDLNLCGKPHLVYNLDETSFSHDPSKTKVVGAKGVKSTRMISSCGRENTTVLICCSADGKKLPPLVVFKGKNIMESWLNKSESDKTFYAASKRGWMEGQIFVNWFKKCFLSNVGDERPILLVYDGHSTHITPDLVKMAIENSITIIKLPPHTTHILQPLDVAVFKSLKVSWDKRLVKWQRENPRKRIPKPTFVDLLNRVYNDMDVKNIINGFKKTGLYDEDLALNGNPVNHNAISNDVFNPADIEKYNTIKKSRLINSDTTATPLNDNKNDEPSTDQSFVDLIGRSEIIFEIEVPQITNLTQYIPLEPQLSAETNSSVGEDQPGCSHSHNLEVPQVTNLAQYIPLEPQLSAETNSSVREDQPGCSHLHNLEVPQTSEVPKKSFEELLLRMVKTNTADTSTNPPQKRRKVCPNGEIVTTEAYLKLLQEKETKKEYKIKAKQTTNQQNLNTKKKYQRNKTRDDSPSSSESSLSLHEEEDAEEKCVDVVLEDYVVVPYEDLYFPGQVIKITDTNITVKHMKKSGKLGWRWPEKSDLWDYRPEDIIQIIPPPIMINKRGAYDVPSMKKFETEEFKFR